MNAPFNSTQSRTVELSEDEFNDIYTLLETCIKVEMGVPENEENDCKEFVRSCTRILNSASDRPAKVRHDMQRGFIPLLERLYSAKSSPVRTNDGVYYRINF